MYFTLSPFFYFMANQKDIEAQFTIENNGEHSYITDKNVVKHFAENYIKTNSHGVDEYKKDKYVKFICEQLAPNLWND